jgi:hypothetical protein
MSEFFLWGGFVFSLLWHLPTLIVVMIIYLQSREPDFDPSGRASRENLVTFALCFLSGVSLCAFGYFAFLPKY